MRATVTVDLDSDHFADSLDWQERLDFILGIDRRTADWDFTETLILLLIQSLKEDAAASEDWQNFIGKVKSV